MRFFEQHSEDKPNFFIGIDHCDTKKGDRVRSVTANFNEEQITITVEPFHGGANERKSVLLSPEMLLAIALQYNKCFPTEREEEEGNVFDEEMYYEKGQEKKDAERAEEYVEEHSYSGGDLDWDVIPVEDSELCYHTDTEEEKDFYVKIVRPSISEKIGTIKDVRDVTGFDLKRCKDAVELSAEESQDVGPLNYTQAMDLFERLEKKGTKTFVWNARTNSLIKDSSLPIIGSLSDSAALRPFVESKTIRDWPMKELLKKASEPVNNFLRRNGMQG